jgi:hypothetical protein
MPTHEAKPCPRCGHLFACRVGSITQCDCTRIQLSVEEKAFIAERYNECLCLACLTDLKNKYIFFREKFFGG